MLFTFSDYLIAIDPENVAHAAKFGILPNVNRGAICGVTVKLYGVRTCIKRNGEWVEEVSVLPWPPRVSKWKELQDGADRCRVCYVKTGQPRPHAMFDDVSPADDVFGPCDKLRQEAKANG